MELTNQYIPDMYKNFIQGRRQTLENRLCYGWGHGFDYYDDYWKNIIRV